MDTDKRLVLDELRLYFAHSQSQTRNTQQILLDGKADLETCNLELAKMRKALVPTPLFLQLREAREQIAKYLDMCSSQRSPIRILPYELLSRILVLCCADDIAVYAPGWKPSKPWRQPHWQAVQVSSVCLGWRDVAYDSPQLWTAFDVHFSSRNFAADPIVARLKRSKSLPLSIRFKGTIRNGNTCWQDVLHLIMEESSRWQYVHFVVSVRDEIKTRFRDILRTAQSFPIVESLCITARSPLFSRVFHRLPLLRSLTLEGCDSLLELDDETLSGIDNMSVKGIPYLSLAKYLKDHGSAFTNLASLSIKHLLLDHDLEFSPLEMPALPSLNFLSIMEQQECDMDRVLESLSQLDLSHLMSLQLSLLKEYGNPDLQLYACDFLVSTRATSVKELHLQGVDYCTWILHHLPELTFLVLFENDYYENLERDGRFNWEYVIDILRVPFHNEEIGEMDALLLKLEHLEIRVCMGSDFDLRAVADMVESRRSSCNWSYSGNADMVESRRSSCNWSYSGNDDYNGNTLKDIKLRLPKEEKRYHKNSSGYHLLMKQKALGLGVNFVWY
ncbi:hypothetical protein VKT23_013731 [Stygiomarasmius scandens]|uniref:F-box domain-containing protein n=1 Tax=Marasmiellus scandens TaxID=2682957 RepID=A0ABR1J4W7_9AGAR